MHGKSVSPLMRVRKPRFSVWYQILSSHGHGVSTVEMKSTASGCVTVTMYSLAPMPSNAGTSAEGICRSLICKPQPECAYPVTAPCRLAHCSTGSVHVGQSSSLAVPG